MTTTQTINVMIVKLKNNDDKMTKTEIRTKIKTKIKI